MKFAVILAALLCLPAAAKPIATAAGPGMGIVLFDDNGACPAGARQALWIEARGRVPGCWFEAHDRVWLFWEDGDHHGIPRAVFKFESV